MISLSSLVWDNSLQRRTKWSKPQCYSALDLSFSLRFCSPYLLLAAGCKCFVGSGRVLFVCFCFLTLAYEIMFLLNPVQYVVNLVRKISALTFNSDNSLACFVLIQNQIPGKAMCSGFFNKLK